MSRGGFRGGRGGGRGGRGGGMQGGIGFGHNQISMTEWNEGVARLKQQSRNDILYPPLDNNSVSYLTPPTEQEALIMAQTISLCSTLATGKLPEGEQGLSAVKQPGQLPPWRLAGEKKVVGIEIESYSDRFNLPSTSVSLKIDPVALKMDPSMFPPALWAAYFENQTEKKSRPKKKRKIDDMGGDDDKVEEESEISEEEDFDFDDDDSDHQDYDANYFDNGEGDDDEGGDDEGGDNYED